MQLYDYTIYPIEYIYKSLYLFFNEYTHSYGLALILLSILTYSITHPLMKWAAGLSRDEQNVQKYMSPQLERIKNELKGAEQHHAIKRLYKRYAYHPVMAVRSAVGVLLQLPFLMAAYYMLSNLQDIRGMEWLFFKDLSKPDALLGTINVLPFVMTGVNLLSVFTTPGFGKRERLQAVIIAVLFLVLLYDAPSALLIYWTFNNFWTLLVNIFDLLLKNFNTVQRFINSKFIREKFRSSYDYKYICFVLAFTGAFAVPLDIFLNNISEFWFKTEQIIPWFMIWTLAAYVLFIAVYFIIGNKFRHYYLMILFGALLGVVIQSYFINLDYGVLNGETIDWDRYKIHGIVNTVVWIVCMSLPFVLLKYWGTEVILLKLNKVCMILFLFQIVSLSYVYIQIPEVQKKSEVTEYNYVLTSDKMFDISSRENVIVFVLDCFDNTIFDDILRKEPWVRNELTGFTYYSNATSVHGGTDTALPHILTGFGFKNNMTVKEYVNDAWLKTDFFNILEENKYDSRIYTFNSFVASTTDKIANLKRAKLVNRVSKNVLKKYIKVSLFRELPHILKKKFVVYSDDITKNPNKVVDKKIKPYVQNDLAFFKKLSKGITINDKSNAFRLYHLRGPHPPHTYNSNLEKVKQSSYYEQGLGSLKIVFEYLKQLKTKKIYNDTVFAIIADHGYWDRLAHGPIVCFKKANSFNGGLQVSDNPVSLDDLHSSLLSRYVSGDSVYDHPFWLKSKGDKRYVYFRGKDLSLNEWLVDGDMKDRKAWKLNKSIAFNNELTRTYSVGSIIKFGSLGNGINYLKSGWRALDIGGAYSDRNKVPSLEFHLNNMKDADLSMLIKFNVTDKNIKSGSTMNFIVNDKFNAKNGIKAGRNDIRIRIPKEYIVNNKINIKCQSSYAYGIQVLQINSEWQK